MKFDFYKEEPIYRNYDEVYSSTDRSWKTVVVETIENIESFGRMDEYYVLTDYEGNQFIRDFKLYSKIDMWIEDQDEYDPGEENPIVEEVEVENNIVDLFGNKVKVAGD